MSDRGAGKWLPYDLNGTVHECNNKKYRGSGSGPSEAKQEPQQKPLTLEALDARLKKIEGMFNINGGLQK